MITALIEGATAARRASHSGRAIEIVITEIGLIVRGTCGNTRRTHSLELDWPEFDASPALLGNSVALVAHELERAHA